MKPKFNFKAATSKSCKTMPQDTPKNLFFSKESDKEGSNQLNVFNLDNVLQTNSDIETLLTDKIPSLLSVTDKSDGNKIIIKPAEKKVKKCLFNAKNAVLKPKEAAKTKEKCNESKIMLNNDSRDGNETTLESSFSRCEEGSVTFCEDINIATNNDNIQLKILECYDKVQVKDLEKNDIGNSEPLTLTEIQTSPEIRDGKVANKTITRKCIFNVQKATLKCKNQVMIQEINVNKSIDFQSENEPCKTTYMNNTMDIAECNSQSYVVDNLLPNNKDINDVSEYIKTSNIHDDNSPSTVNLADDRTPSTLNEVSQHISNSLLLSSDSLKTTELISKVDSNVIATNKKKIPRFNIKKAVCKTNGISLNTEILNIENQNLETNLSILEEGKAINVKENQKIIIEENKKVNLEENKSVERDNEKTLNEDKERNVDDGKEINVEEDNERNVQAVKERRDKEDIEKNVENKYISHIEEKSIVNADENNVEVNTKYLAENNSLVTYVGTGDRFSANVATEVESSCTVNILRNLSSTSQKVKLNVRNALTKDTLKSPGKIIEQVKDVAPLNQGLVDHDMSSLSVVSETKSNVRKLKPFILKNQAFIVDDDTVDISKLSLKTIINMAAKHPPPKFRDDNIKKIKKSTGCSNSIASVEKNENVVEESIIKFRVDSDGNIVPDKEKKILYNPLSNESLEVVVEDARYIKSTYRSHTKKRLSGKRWTNIETDNFYKALFVFGTNYSHMASIFKGRDRNDLKQKFKVEEKKNPGTIDYILRNLEPDKMDTIVFDSHIPKVKTRKDVAKRILKCSQSDSDQSEEYIAPPKKRKFSLDPSKNGLNLADGDLPSYF